MESSNDPSLFFGFMDEIEDFRTGNRLVYPASGILFMGFLGFLYGAQSWYDVVDQSGANIELIRRYQGDSFKGVPSHDTFRRFFSLLNPGVIEKAFRNLMGKLWQSRIQEGDSEVLAIDGKYQSSVTGEEALNVVSAYATKAGLCLGQEVADKKMNEPEQLRKLVESLYIEGCIVTADALHCQEESARAILGAKADFLLTVKDNQPNLKKAILEGIGSEKRRIQPRNMDYAEEITRGHGREETRSCYSCSSLGWLSLYDKQWEGIKSFGVVTCKRTVSATNKTSIESRCFISSLEKDAFRQLHIIRDHWKIENNLHGNWMSPSGRMTLKCRKTNCLTLPC